MIMSALRAQRAACGFGMETDGVAPGPCTGLAVAIDGSKLAREQESGMLEKGVKLFCHCSGTAVR